MNGNIDVFKDICESDLFYFNIYNNLQMVSDSNKILFAAYCSEGLYQYYLNRFEGVNDKSSSSILGTILDKVWGHINNKTMNQIIIEKALLELEEIEFEDDCSDETDVSIDVVTTIWFAVSACSKDSINNAISALKNVFDRVYQILSDKILGRVCIIDTSELDKINSLIEEESLMKNIKQKILEISLYLKTKNVFDDEEITKLKKDAATLLFEN